MTANKGGRPTNKQLQERADHLDRAARYSEQEAKRANRIQIDTRIMQFAWLVGVGIAFATSAVISFNGIAAVAPLVGIPDWMSNLFFFFVEFMYVLFLIAYLNLESRGEMNLRGPLIGMWFFAGVAIVSNGYHTVKFHDWDWTSPDLWWGLVLSVSAPIAIVSITKLMSRVVFAKAVTMNE